MNKVKIIITFDLHNAKPSQYEEAYSILEELGFQKVSPIKALSLPSTTVFGEMDLDKYEIRATDIRDFIWDYLKENKIKPKRVFGGILEDWAVRTK